MASYETLFIVRPDIEESDLSKVVARVEDIVKSSGGTILGSEVWGKRRLAYEVNKYTEGVYVKLNFDAAPAVVEKLRDHFRFNEDVIRDLIVQQEFTQGERREAEEHASAHEARTPDDDDED
jgi:small subunit ribosomal protein S6